MSISLEERIRRAAELLDQPVHRPVSMLQSAPPAQHSRSRVWLRVAAALLVVAAVAGLAALASGDSSDPGSTASASTVAVENTEAGAPATAETASAASLPAAETTTPALAVPDITLPTSGDLTATPYTAVASAEIPWYRLQPDLDVAWLEDGSGSLICVRTPVIEQCQPDQFVGGGYMAIRTGGAQWLIVTMDHAAETTVPLDDGSTTVVETFSDGQIGWRTGRIALPDNRRPADAAMVFDPFAPDDSSGVVPTTAASSNTVGS